MKNKQQPRPSGDWIKALSLLALMSKEVPEGRSGSAVVAAFVIVALSIYSRGVFLCLHLLATGVLYWWAWESGDALPLGYALLYTLMAVVFVAEGERIREGKGQFLSSLWWAGQLLIFSLDASFAERNHQQVGFFTQLFVLISGGMMLYESGRGFRAMIAAKPKTIGKPVASSAGTFQAPTDANDPVVDIEPTDTTETLTANTTEPVSAQAETPEAETQEAERQQAERQETETEIDHVAEEETSRAKAAHEEAALLERKEPRREQASQEAEAEADEAPPDDDEGNHL